MKSPHSHARFPWSFEKWEGLGNDFLLTWPEGEAFGEWRALAQRLCDRHFGVGADGVIEVDMVPPAMRVFNADGSRPEMCGNGLRCVAAAVSRRNGVDVGDLVVTTDAGPRSARIQALDDRSYDVAVNMGTPQFGASHVDVEGHGDHLDAEGLGAGLLVSVGNPHWVFLDVAADRDVAELGPRLERDPRFARRTNVEFVRSTGPGQYRVDVWERGCGITLACGSGAVAVAASLVRTGRERPGEPLQIDLPGGRLVCQVGPGGAVAMTGPARKVYEGQLDLAHFGKSA